MLGEIEGLYSNRLGSLRNNLAPLCTPLQAIVAFNVGYRVIVIVASVELPYSATDYTGKDLELLAKSNFIF